MFYIIKNGKIESSSDQYIQGEGTTIQKDFTNEELEKINSGYSYNIETGEFEESEESKEFEKQQDVLKFKEIEKKATEKRSQYLTAELLPEGEFKDLKLAKLFEEGEEIKAEYEAMMNELIQKYGETILNDLI